MLDDMILATSFPPEANTLQISILLSLDCFANELPEGLLHFTSNTKS